MSINCQTTNDKQKGRKMNEQSKKISLKQTMILR